MFVGIDQPGRAIAGALDLDGEVSGEGGFATAAFLRGHDDCFHENCCSLQDAEKKFMKVYAISGNMSNPSYLIINNFLG